MKKDGFENKSIDIIIPVGLDEEPDLRKSVESVIELHRKAGFRKFALFGGSKGWRNVGYPPRECFEEMAGRILEFKKGLRDYDIMVGWWNTLTLKSGKYGEHRIVRIDGTESGFSNCPLAPAFQKRFSEDVAFVAEKARPFTILFEDDYGINCHRGYGCFCELHLKEFARRTGRFVRRRWPCVRPLPSGGRSPANNDCEQRLRTTPSGEITNTLKMRHNFPVDPVRRP